MRSTFRIHFYVNGNRGKNGKVPIIGRITINGSVAQFNCNQSIRKELWDVKANMAKGKSEEAIEVNNILENIKDSITRHYHNLKYTNNYVTAEMVRNAFLGVDDGDETLLQAFDNNNEEFKKRVGKDRSEGTLKKYIIVRKYIAEFIRYRYKCNDIPLKNLNPEFISEFCNYLKCTAGLCQSSVWVYYTPLKHVVSVAHRNGKINRNPFAGFHISPKVKQREFLTEKELQRFSEINLKKPSWDLARDLFIFSSWTGISYTDIKNLTHRNIVEINGSKWIVSKRQKTGIPFQVKLLPAPQLIVEKYKNIQKNNTQADLKDKPLFNMGSRDIINKQLKNIAKMCNIDKNVSFHLARHSFAVRALNFGMPIESVSKILGHMKITTTQIYAKVTNLKLEYDINMFENRINNYMMSVNNKIDE